ncbi:MAG: hypothetical protein HFI26_15175 [Lachnospiraceae bacterium]|nr:hypothetical protein [Lachnospiraceae bacterium]
MYANSRTLDIGKDCRHAFGPHLVVVGIYVEVALKAFGILFVDVGCGVFQMVSIAELP